MADEEKNTPPLADDSAKLREELLQERFESVAAKHGLDADFVDLVAPQAHAWLDANKREATRESLAEYMAELKRSKPKLFASAPVAAARSTNTAPVVPNSSPAVPAPSALETPFSHWRALKSAGRADEASAFYLLNTRAINRGLS